MIRGIGRRLSGTGGRFLLACVALPLLALVLAYFDNWHQDRFAVFRDFHKLYAVLGVSWFLFAVVEEVFEYLWPEHRPARPLKRRTALAIGSLRALLRNAAVMASSICVIAMLGYLHKLPLVILLPATVLFCLNGVYTQAQQFARVPRPDAR